MLYYIVSALDGYIISTSYNIDKITNDINIYRYVQFISTIYQLLRTQNTNSSNESRPISVKYGNLSTIVSSISINNRQIPLIICLICDAPPDVISDETAITAAENNETICDEYSKCITMINVMTYLILNFNVKTNVLNSVQLSKGNENQNDLLITHCIPIMENISRILLENADQNSSIASLEKPGHGKLDCNLQIKSNAHIEDDYVIGFDNDVLNELIMEDLDQLVTMFDALNELWLPNVLSELNRADSLEMGVGRRKCDGTYSNPSVNYDFKGNQSIFRSCWQPLENSMSHGVSPMVFNIASSSSANCIGAGRYEVRYVEVYFMNMVNSSSSDQGSNNHCGGLKGPDGRGSVSACRENEHELGLDCNGNCYGSICPVYDDSNAIGNSSDIGFICVHRTPIPQLWVATVIYMYVANIDSLSSIPTPGRVQRPPKREVVGIDDKSGSTSVYNTNDFQCWCCKHLQILTGRLGKCKANLFDTLLPHINTLQRRRYEAETSRWNRYEVGESRKGCVMWRVTPKDGALPIPTPLKTNCGRICESLDICLLNSNQWHMRAMNDLLDSTLSNTNSPLRGGITQASANSSVLPDGLDVEDAVESDLIISDMSPSTKADLNSSNLANRNSAVDDKMKSISMNNSCDHVKNEVDTYPSQLPHISGMTADNLNNDVKFHTPIRPQRKLNAKTKNSSCTKPDADDPINPDVAYLTDFHLETPYTVQRTTYCMDRVAEGSMGIDGVDEDATIGMNQNI